MIYISQFDSSFCLSHLFCNISKWRRMHEIQMFEKFLSMIKSIKKKKYRFNHFDSCSNSELYIVIIRHSWSRVNVNTHQWSFVTLMNHITMSMSTSMMKAKCVEIIRFSRMNWHIYWIKFDENNCTFDEITVEISNISNIMKNINHCSFNKFENVMKFTSNCNSRQICMIWWIHWSCCHRNKKHRSKTFAIESLLSNFFTNRQITSMKTSMI